MSELSRMKWRNREIARTIFFFFVLLALFGALVSVPRLSTPLLFAYVIALMVRPIVHFLTHLGLPHTLSIIGLLLSLILLSAWPIAKMAPIVSEETRNLQYHVPKVENYIRDRYQVLQLEVRKRTGYNLSDHYLTNFLDSGNTVVADVLLTLPKLLASLLEWAFLLPLFIFFILKDGFKFLNILLSICPNGLFERFYSLTHEFGKKIGGYIFAKLIEASIIFVLITAGLWFLDIHFSLLLGILAGVTNIIPYLGPIIGAVPGLIYVLAEYGMGGTFAAILILYVIANAIDIAIVFPILVSRIVDLHPLLVVISVIIGSQSLGVVGMVISIPAAVALKLIALEFYQAIYTRQG